MNRLVHKDLRSSIRSMLFMMMISLFVVDFWSLSSSLSEVLVNATFSCVPKISMPNNAPMTALDNARPTAALAWDMDDRGFVTSLLIGDSAAGVLSPPIALAIAAFIPPSDDDDDDDADVDDDDDNNIDDDGGNEV